MTKCVSFSPFSSTAAAFAIILVAGSSALLLLAPTVAGAASVNNRPLNLRGIGSLQPQPRSTTVFPPLSDCERSADMSSLRLSLDTSASGFESGGSTQRFCFRIRSSGGCDPQSKCCDSSARTASKVEFDVVAGCKDSLLQVTFNGLPASYEYDTVRSVLRVTGLDTPAAATAAAPEICVYLDATSDCPSLSQLCSRQGDADAAGACRYAIFSADRTCCPVSVVPIAAPLLTSASVLMTPSSGMLTAKAYRSDFPYCQCQRSAAGSRLFATASPNVTFTDNGLTRICFDLGLHDVCAESASKCCEFTLYKMELEVDRACADALAYTTINGVQHVRYFQTAPHAAIKIVNLNRLPAAVNGTQICLFLRPECNSLEKLCAVHDGSCTVGLFSKPSTGAANCCPLSSVRI